MGIRTPVAGVKGQHDWPLHYISRRTFVPEYIRVPVIYIF